jgi:ribosomal protein S18 acetylase RimI-like enzyme
MAKVPPQTRCWLQSAKLCDYPFAIELYLDGARRYLSKIGRWDRRRLTVRFRRGYRVFQTRIVCMGNRRIGWVQVAEHVGRLHLRQLHLIPTHRNRGIGTSLIEDLLAHALAENKPMILDVMHGNPARNLYRRLGFRQCGRDADRIQMIWRPAQSGRVQ